MEGDPLQLPPSVGYDHPEDWVGHGQYSTQPTTCTNEVNGNELNVGGGVLLGCMCVYNSYSTLFTVVELQFCVIRVYVCDTCTMYVDICVIVCVVCMCAWQCVNL